MKAAALAFLCVVGPIHDGDTFTCKEGPRVRVWGVDAPELATEAGPASRRALTRLIAGKTLECEKKGRSYDRVVARCFVDGRDVAEEMVRGGFAADWPKFSHGAYSQVRPAPDGTN